MKQGGGPVWFADADGLARAIVERTDGRIRLALPLGLGKPCGIVNALVDLACADPSISLSILTALTLERPRPRVDLERRLLEPAGDRLFGRYLEPAYAGKLRDGTLPDNVEVYEFFHLMGRWLGVERMQQNHVSANYTDALRVAADWRPNLVAQLVAARDGRFSLSCNTDISVDLLKMRRDGSAEFLLAAEINAGLPFMDGSGALHEAEIDLIHEPEDGGFELFSVVKRPVALAEQAIGLHVARTVRDGGTLQIGIGSIGDAAAHALLVRHLAGADFRHLVARSPFPVPAQFDETGPFETGLYAVTEMLVEGLVELFEAGIVRREADGAAIHAGFFLGCRSFYQALREMPEERLAKIAMMPVSFTNALYGGEAEKRLARSDARFVNNTMMVTLLGAAVSDTIEGGRVVGGVGGQFDFVAQAFALAGARSILTVNASRRSRGRTRSNLVWSYPHETVPRQFRDLVVTEYGIADLRGRTDADCIKALVSIADGRFQEELLEEARRAGKVERDWRIPEDRRGNTPERLAEWLGPARRCGLLPAFPFGTDFTATEQRLLPALELLADAAHSPTRLARLALAGLAAGEPPAADRDCLERMSLAAPAGLRQRVTALLLRAALREVGDKSASGSSHA